jgi:hypothetical protein
MDSVRNHLLLLPARWLALLLALGALTPGARAQGSDNCATPQAIAGAGPFFVDTTLATTAPPPAVTTCGPIPMNVWYRWHAPATGGIAVLSLCGTTTIPMQVTVYQYQGAGCPMTPGTTATYCSGTCFVSWATVPGFYYVVEIGGFYTALGGTGTFTITIAPPGGPGTSYCDPGVGGVIACPCSNPPAGPGRGCNNSSNTGGASLDASGSASLGVDTVVFTTAGEKPTAFTILLQGTLQNAGGIPFGQGVRCVGGTLRRLYARTAVGGSITVPSGADLPVSARSAALGDFIAPGSDRFYLAYYRDPIPLGGCPASLSWNTTQSYQITWGP